MSQGAVNFTVVFILLLSWSTVIVVSEIGEHNHEHENEASRLVPEIGEHNHEHENEASRLDPFHKLSHAPVMSVRQLENFTHAIFENLKCDGHDHEYGQDKGSHEECEDSLCIEVVDLVNLVGGSSSEGITEEQFENASLVLLYLATDVDNRCHEHVNTSSLSVDLARSSLLLQAQVVSQTHRHIHASGIKLLLDSLKNSIDHTGHDHEEDHDEEDDDHDEEDKHDHDDEDHDDDDHQNDADANHLVVRTNCLATDSLLYYMNVDTTDFVDSEVMIGHLASVVVYLLSEGSDIEDSCRLLPAKSAFIDNLFSQFGDGSTSMNLKAFEELMAALEINPGAEEHDHQVVDNHDGHDHRRRRRRAYLDLIHHLSRPSLAKRRRSRRQASTNTAFAKCYTGEQLMALYDSPNSVNQEVFKEICPTLVSQRLYGDCSIESTTSSISDAEKYGYGTLAVFIICLCSVFGVVLIPCTSQKVYSAVMATFLGLAVGTLFADAILHLIPRVFGVHVHKEGDGHDHDSSVKVEDFVQSGLVIMAALYLFYIIEMFMSRCCGHSHGDEKKEAHANHDHDIGNNIAMSQKPKDHDEEDGKIEKSESQKKYSVTSELESTSTGCFGLPTIAVMIVIGDAIHNLADGFVIGASFNSNVSTGMATSIAVFCHELPHELGDFAVLLQAGCSFGKALFLNILSSITAFVGLYIGMSLSSTNDTDTEHWIFAVAAGMFIYISLVDLLPQLLKGRGFSIVYHNLGMLIGFLAMFLLVIYEDHIKV